MTTTDAAALDVRLPDDVSVRHWFALYGVFFVALVLPLAIFLSRQEWTWNDWLSRPAETFNQTSPIIKLLGFTLYASMCCTFLPLPTGWIVAGVATREAAVAAGVSDSVLVVALLTASLIGAVGAIGSTMANLNDYHLFTWMLRHHRIAAVRTSRRYQSAARWFSRSPFFLVFVFNVIPVPVDVVRMLATTCRYGRIEFAAANFLGRFVRYAVIAFATYWWDLGWVAPVALLGVAAVFGVVRVGPGLVRKIFPRPNPCPQAVSNTSNQPEESKS